MSSDYRKLSQLQTLPLNEIPLSSNDNITGHLMAFDTNGGLSDILHCNHYIVPPPVIPADYIVATLTPGTTSFAAGLAAVSPPSQHSIRIYRLINNTIPEYISYSNSLTFEISKYALPSNLVEISAIITKTSGDNTGRITKTDRIITKFAVNNPEISTLELNLPALNQLHILNASNIGYFNVASFDNIQNVQLTGLSKFAGGLQIGTLTNNPYIKLQNNAIAYYEFIGNGTTSLSPSNFLLSGPTLPKHIKFNNCQLTLQLAQQLLALNIEIEY